MKKIVFLTLLVLSLSVLAVAQPRPADRSSDAVTAPSEYAARYEGGIFGSSGKEPGTLKVDQENMRLVFIRKADGKEMFTIPYDSLMVVFPDSKDGVPQAGKVVSALPVPGAGLANLLNKETKYANITFVDPDIDIQGTVSFRFDKKADLLLFVNKLGTSAKMAQRGDAYYKPKKPVF